MKTLAVALLLFALGAGGTYAALYVERRGSGAPEAAEGRAGTCVKHRLDACPFCDKSLVEKLGECGEHGVPESMCTRCNPALIPAFRATGDWCDEHGLPESQCRACNPDLVIERPAPEEP